MPPAVTMSWLTHRVDAGCCNHRHTSVVSAGDRGLLRGMIPRPGSERLTLPSRLLDLARATGIRGPVRASLWLER